MKLVAARLPSVGSRVGVATLQLVAQAIRSPGATVPSNAIGVVTPAMTLAGLVPAIAKPLVSVASQQMHLLHSVHGSGLLPE